MSRAAEVRFERVWKRLGTGSVAVRDVSFTAPAGTLGVNSLAERLGEPIRKVGVSLD